MMVVTSAVRVLANHYSTGLAPQYPVFLLPKHFQAQ
jgi:hypothetical protein